MAVIRYHQVGDNTVNYISTLAFFSCVSCVILMLKFGRFKTSFNVQFNGKRKSVKGHENYSSSNSINGAYRTNRDELFIYSNNSEEQQRKTISSVPVPPPPANFGQPTRPMRQTKSTSDLIKEQNLPPNVQAAQSSVSLDPRGAETENNKQANTPQAVEPKKNKTQLDAQRRVEKQRLEEQKKLEKQRLAEQKKLEKQQAEEQKKRNKLAQQEQAKQEKLRKERAKKEAQLAKKTKKGQAPQRPLANPLAQASAQPATSQDTSNPRSQPSSTQYSTNTLESSISKSSGPPPYVEDSTQQSDSNVTYSKPVDTGSWDMISQHRHNVINRHMKAAAPAPREKVTTMDLNYTLGEDNSKVNSDA